MYIFENEIDKRKCARRTVVAVIVNNGEYFVGSNWCNNPQDVCPIENLTDNERQNGERYKLCKDICKQDSHAEVDACRKAGAEARNGTLLLYNHYYSCDDCKKVMGEYGISSVIVVDNEKF